MNDSYEIDRRLFLTRLCAVAATAALIGSSLKAEVPSAGTQEDAPATHNMLVVGTETVFLSHLPMFDGLNEQKSDYTSPHRYQVILEARFSSGGKDVTVVYTEDRKSHPRTKMYTLSPTDDFVLAKLFTPDVQKPELSSFRATVFRGHLERGGKPINGLKDIVVTVKQVMHARKFEPADDKPEELTYFLFGKGMELFLAHSIIKPPDFDQIVSVMIPDSHFTDDELRRGISVVFQDRKNTASRRLKETQQAGGQFHVSGAHQFLKLQVQSGTELYFEQGELRVPARFGATSEEKKSGF
ncbi:MAG TPA: hypothetical protein VJ420_06065 [Candidatus Udaeobacter sp.]|nr:hypothetical protein [Candidatus Udaeobacter sp.]